MPDPILGTAASATDPGQQGTPGQTQPQGQQGQPSQQGQDPAWLNAIQDQAMRDEARKSYMLHSDYTKKTQELGEQRKTWDSEREQMSRQNQEYLQGWRQSYDALQDAQKKFQENPTQRNAQNLQEAQAEQAEYWKDYEYMQPAQQGQHISKFVANQVNQYAQQVAQQFQQHYQNSLQQQQQYINNYFTTWLDAQQRFPGNVEQQKAYLKSVYEVSAGQIDPRELAYNRMTATSDRQALIDEGRKLGLAEAEQKAKTQNQFELNGSGAPTPYRSPNTGDKKSREDALNQAITQKFGATVWQNS